MHPPRAQFDAFAGVHRFKRNGAAHFESFEVFYIGRDNRTSAAIAAGWYWRPLPLRKVKIQADAIGPFTSSRAAYRDARRQG